MLDILIRNGQVIDGTGAGPRQAGVAVADGRIVEVGSLEGARARTTIDAAGCVVAPGFVDMHSHADMTLPFYPTADNLVLQGITTVVTGQCGSSPAPLLPQTRASMLPLLDTPGLSLPWERWTTLGSYLQDLARGGISVNVVPLVGHGTIRGAVMGLQDCPPDRGQMARMSEEALQAMDEGAIGLSSGLIYPPGIYARTPELVEMSRPVAVMHGYYFSHIRGEGETLLEAVAEAIAIGKDAGVAVQISHFKAAGEANWNKAGPALGLIDRARAEGLDVSADMYPYEAGQTGLMALLPGWAQEGSGAAVLERLADASLRARMAADMETTGFFRGLRWEGVLICGAPGHPEYEGRTVAELAAQAARTPHDWIFDALVETGLGAQVVLFTMSEANIRMQMRHGAMMFGTDSCALAGDGMPGEATPHPRGYGTFARILGRYVRELGVLTLAEAIWKMTGLPAQKLGWQDRGLAKKGYRADLVVLDPWAVADLATYERPRQSPAGIAHVIVNGVPVVRDGAHTRARPGAVLRATTL